MDVLAPSRDRRKSATSAAVVTPSNFHQPLRFELFAWRAPWIAEGSPSLRIANTSRACALRRSDATFDLQLQQQASHRR